MGNKKSEIFFNNNINKLRSRKSNCDSYSDEQIVENNKRIFYNIKKACDDLVLENRIINAKSLYEKGIRYAIFSETLNFKKNLNRKIFSTYLRLRQKENNQKFIGNISKCMDQCCNKRAVFFYNDKTQLPRRYCKIHYEKNKEIGRIHSKVKLKRRKKNAQLNAHEYFNREKSKIKNIKMKNKSKIMRLIVGYYNDNVLSEAKFCLLIHDILRLLGGDPVREYPIFLNRKTKQSPDMFVDCLDRKFKIAIETKSCFRYTPSQFELEKQLISYKYHFKGYRVMGVSPDSYVGWKNNNIIGIFELLDILSKK